MDLDLEDLKSNEAFTNPNFCRILWKTISICVIDEPELWIPTKSMYYQCTFLSYSTLTCPSDVFFSTTVRATSATCRGGSSISATRCNPRTDWTRAPGISGSGPLGLQMVLWVCKLGIPKNGHRVVKNPISQWLVAEMFFFPLQCVCGCSCVFSFDFKIGQFMLNTLPSVEEVLAHGTFSIFHQIPCARAHQPNTNNRKERA